MTALNYYAVIGRIPGDDEDTCLIFQVESANDAVRAFADRIYEDRGLSEGDREATIRMIGRDLSVFVNHVLMSRSFINHA